MAEQDDLTQTEDPSDCYDMMRHEVRIETGIAILNPYFFFFALFHINIFCRFE